jgi:two-component system LytT family response regulator
VEANHEILALIVEDDPLNSAMLSDLLNDHFPSVRIAGVGTSISEAKPLLKCLEFDLLFLDIELPDGNGFNLLASLPVVNFGVIVTTSFSKYAIDAIHCSALDYLIKPISLKNLSNAMERFFQKQEFNHAGNHHSDKVHSLFHRLPLPTSDGIVFVKTDEIVHAEADGVYTLFYLQTGKKIMVSRPLCEFEDRLISRNFFRIHNSHIINLDAVSLYVRGEGGHVVMINNSSVPVSRSRKDEFLRLVGF